MRTKKPFLIALFLCAWTIVSYYLLIRQTESGNGMRHAAHGPANERGQQDDLLRQLNRLEANIQQENMRHDQLVKTLIEIARLKDKKDENHGDGLAGDKAGLPKNQTINSNSIYNGAKADAHQFIDDNHLDSPDVIDNEIIASNNVIEGADSDAPIINRLKELYKRNQDFNGPIIPILVFACNRISVSNCLDDLVKYRPNSYQFPIIVSQVSEHYLLLSSTISMLL